MLKRSMFDLSPRSWENRQNLVMAVLPFFLLAVSVAVTFIVGGWTGPSWTTAAIAAAAGGGCSSCSPSTSRGGRGRRCWSSTTSG